MFDFAWSELALIAAVALIVIGPKDLPRVLRTAGTWVGRARAIAREFQGSLDQIVREAELEEVRKEVEKAASVNLKAEIEKTIDPKGELQKTLSEPIVTDAPTTTPPAAPAAPESGSETPALAAPDAAALPEASPAPEPIPAEPAPAELPPAKSGTHA